VAALLEIDGRVTQTRVYVTPTSRAKPITNGLDHSAGEWQIAAARIHAIAVTTYESMVTRSRARIGCCAHGAKSFVASWDPHDCDGPAHTDSSFVMRDAALRCVRMPTQCSFDVTSNVDLQEVDNALNQARKEVTQRYDFKGSKASIEFDPKESKLVLAADDDFKLNALWEIVSIRLVRRNVPVKNLTRGPAQPAANSTVRQEVALQQGISTEKARDIVKFIKDAKLKKVQASIQGDQLRVSSASKDDLQDVMRLLREQDFGVALQFGNYRG
jgi:cyclic-di-GMP-binding protein